jgi:peptidyl-prolyl cis-trans isomerase D
LQPVAVVSRDKPQGLQPQELSAALRADTANLPNWVGIDLGAQGYAVLKVIKQQNRETPTAEQATQELRQYGQWWASAEGQAYYNLLKKRLKVEMKVPQPVVGSAKQG